jgi:leader peptidase (prepilin peptidase)/N-methyltransferase
MVELPTLLAVFAFAWGAIWGSFLNVVIHRLPLGLSLLTPPSHCPACERPIRWYQNIPIASYLALGGRCAGCKAGISVRYPLVELVTAMLSLAAWQAVSYNPFVPSLEIAAGLFAFHFLFVLALVAITFIDLDTMLIPDIISLPMVVVGLFYGFAAGSYFGVTWVDSLIGSAAGAGIIALVILTYLLLTGQEGMGWGDAKLMAFIGAFLGWKAIPFVLLAGSLQGLAYAGLTLALGGTLPEDPDDVSLADDDTPKVHKEGPAEPAPPARPVRKLKVPFGPFLSLAALEWLFFSNLLSDLFQALFRL